MTSQKLNLDVSFMLDNLKRLQAEATDRKRKEALKNKIHEVNQFALSGEILEHQFYMILWINNKKDAGRELLKQSNEIMARFKAYYSHTTVDPPKVVYFIREYYPDVIFRYPKESMWNLIIRKNVRQQG